MMTSDLNERSLNERSRLRNTPNVLSLVRIFSAPFVVIAITRWAPSWWVLALVIGIIATDSIDGWLARKQGPTDFGGFLDSLADKIAMLSMFGSLIANGWVWWVPVAIMAAREVAMSVWRMRLSRRGVYIAARMLGKRKAFAQNVAIMLTLTPGVMSHASWLSVFAVWIAVVLAVVSFAQYLYDAKTNVM